MAAVVASRLAPRQRPMALPGTQTINSAVPDMLAARAYPRARVQIAPGANLLADSTTWAWVDVTAAVRLSDALSIKRGRSDAAGQAEPSRITFAVNNPAGDWTPLLPTGRFYPYMTLGTPVRVFVNYGSGDVLRGTCFIDELTPGWDATLNMATVGVSSSGLLRRYNQGTRPAQSLLTTWNLTSPRPVAYWPLDDPSGSDAFREAIGAQPSMLWNETEPTFASAGPPASASVVKLAQRTELHVDLTPYTTGTSWTVQWICYIPSAPSASTPIVVLDCFGTLAEWRINIVPSGGVDTLQVQAFTATSGTAVVSTSGSFAVSGASEPYAKWLSFSFSCTQSGSDIAYTLTMSEMTTYASLTVSGTATTQTIGNPARIGVHNGWAHTDWLFGAFALYNTVTSYPSDILDGYNWQTAADRMQTAATYENEPTVTLVGSAADTQWMGPWSISTYVDTLHECEAADGGILFDAKGPYLTYRTRTSRLNLTAALTLDLSLGQIGMPWQPRLDDQRIRNEWTVSRSGGNSGASGSSASYKSAVSQAAVGRYADSKSINVDSDDLLIHHAGWAVNLGTAKGMRYPVVTIDLARNTTLAAAWAAADIGDMIALTNLPVQHPPGGVSLILEGYTETIKNPYWTVAANCSAADPWSVYAVNSATRGRVGNGTSTLAAGVSTTGVTLSVATAAAADLWTTTATYPADFPFTIEVDGEQMSVTAIVGASSPQTFTVTRSTNTVVREHAANAAVTLTNQAPIAL